MSRLALYLLLLSWGAPLAAQTVYVAPSSDNIIGSSTESGGPDQVHLLFVQNRSSVPVIVFGVVLTACENVKQWCAGRSTNITIAPNERRSVGRVEPKMPDRAFAYRWSFSYRADSSDAKFIAALRENGMLADASTVPPVPESHVAPVPAGVERAADAPSVAIASSSAPMSALVAATDVDGIARATSAVAPSRQFFVTNKSAYPIVVYSFNLATCLNVKQVCGRSPVDVHVAAGRTLQIARVDAQDRTRRYSYDWTYDWKLDTTDARVAAALRARGQREGTLGDARNLTIQPEAPVVTRSTKPGFRFKVARESILGSTQVKGAVVLATGACIDPAELASWERDTTISRSAAVPPRLSAGSIILPTLPPALRDSLKGESHVLVRWAVDETGGTMPGTVHVIESPSGPVSVKVCGAILAAHLTPGRDGSGRAVRTWVQAPLRIVQ